jgi:outer membrane receptor protein involved in Fe transport
MTGSHRRIAALAVVIASTVAVTAAVAQPTVDTGSISVSGSGTVAVTGRVVVLGAVSNSRAQIEIQTLRSAAALGLGGRTRRIAPGRDVIVSAGPGVFFGITAANGTIRVTVRGRGISATIAGTGTVAFVGRGTYAFGYPPVTRPWPKLPLSLRQPQATVARRITRATHQTGLA